MSTHAHTTKGVYGALFVRANIWWLSFKKKMVIKNHPVGGDFRLPACMHSSPYTHSLTLTHVYHTNAHPRHEHKTCKHANTQGVYGALFVRANIWWLSFKKKTVIKNHPVGEVFAIALLTVLFKYPIYYLR